MNRNELNVTPEREARLGLAYGTAAYLSWGLFPLYFRAIKSVPPLEIAAHRMVGSALFLTLMTLALGRLPAPRKWFVSWRRVAIHAVTTTLLGFNWLLYVWAVNTGRTLEASLGYFINPLVTVLLGVLFLRETLTRRQVAAVALACLGVLILVVGLGQAPWLPLLLATTFAVYALVRKVARMDPLLGLLGETALQLPLALLYIGFLERSGVGALTTAPSTIRLLLLFAGVITPIPLIWFTAGVRRLPLSTMGLLQYLSPTGQFLLAVGLFGEQFTRIHALAFTCIWISLILYSFKVTRPAGAAARSAPATQ